jgi:hypothetical protein
LDYSNASGLTLAPDLGGVLAGLKGRDQSRFEIVRRLEPEIDEFLLLAAFPVVILKNERALLVAELKSGIGKSVWNSKLQ